MSLDIARDAAEYAPSERQAFRLLRKRKRNVTINQCAHGDNGGIKISMTAIASAKE